MGAKDRTVARIASRAHGVVTRGELLDAGVTRREIQRRVEKGVLIPVYRGVYRVGHRAPSVEAQYLAAVRACGDGAVLSGRAAAHLYRLTRALAMPEVTAPTERRVKGVITHRSRGGIDGATHRGVPISTVPHTLIAISSRLNEDDLTRAAHQARVLYGTKPKDVPPPLPGNLRRVLYGDVRLTLSRLERAFIELLIRQGLPLPETNRIATSRYVDCRWPEYRLTVELDGYMAHDSRHAWQLDRRREREAYARDDDFRRYTWEDVFEDQSAMLNELHALIGRYPVTASARSSAG